MNEQQTLERWGPIVARINSLRTPGNIYDIRYHLGRQEYSCNCPGWRFSRQRPKQCRHTRYCFENRIGTEVATTGAIKQPDGRKRKAKTLAKVFEAEAKSLKPLPYDKLGDNATVTERERQEAVARRVADDLALRIRQTMQLSLSDYRTIKRIIEPMLIAEYCREPAVQQPVAAPAAVPQLAIQTNIRFITFED